MRSGDLVIQLAIEREPELQTLISAAFVRLSQESGFEALLPGDAASIILARQRRGAEAGINTESAAAHRRGRAPA